MKLLAALLISLFAGSLAAEPLVVPKGTKGLPKALAEKCAKGCAVLDQQDFEDLKGLVSNLQEEAFQIGIQVGGQSCKKTKDI